MYCPASDTLRPERVRVDEGMVVITPEVIWLLSGPNHWMLEGEPVTP